MPYFIDTNIAIAYSITVDLFHKIANNIFSNTTETIYWSNNVEYEFNCKFKEITTLFDDFLDDISYVLLDNKKEFDNLSEFEEYVLENTPYIKLDIFKKHGVIEFMWDNYLKSSKTPTKIYSEFTKNSFKVVESYKYRKQQLENKVKLHDCGLTIT